MSLYLTLKMPEFNMSGRIGATIGLASFGVKEAFEKILYGFDWGHLAQEVVEDLAGVIISVVGGYFIAKLLNRKNAGNSKSKA